MTSYNTFIWHAVFRLSGTLNDINDLNQSHLFKKIQDGTAPSLKFIVNSCKQVHYDILPLRLNLSNNQSSKWQERK